MVVLAGDMNGHVGSNSVGYDGMERMVVTGLEIGMQMAPVFAVFRWAKPSHLQCIVHEAGI